MTYNVHGEWDSRAHKRQTATTAKLFNRSTLIKQEVDRTCAEYRRCLHVRCTLWPPVLYNNDRSRCPHQVSAPSVNIAVFNTKTMPFLRTHATSRYCFRRRLCVCVCTSVRTRSRKLPIRNRCNLVGICPTENASSACKFKLTLTFDLVSHFRTFSFHT